MGLFQKLAEDATLMARASHAFKEGYTYDLWTRSFRMIPLALGQKKPKKHVMTSTPLKSFTKGTSDEYLSDYFLRPPVSSSNGHKTNDM